MRACDASAPGDALPGGRGQEDKTQERMLSVIIPIYNEERHIASCMDSVLAQDYPHDDMEVLLVDGMSTDGTRLLLAPYLERYPFVRLLDNPGRTAPKAMNIGIRAAQGEVLMRLDAHALYERNYFSVLTQALARLHADNVGAPCHTDVLHHNARTLAIRAVLSCPFGVGNSSFRTGIDRVTEVDTVPFGCWPRETFSKYGLYDERLTRNQDIELNKRIRRARGRIFIVPDTHCTYLARETYPALARNNYANGLWNIKTVALTRQFSSLSLRHFVPMAFVLSLSLPLVLGFLWHPLWLPGLISLLAYLLALSAVSLRLARAGRLCFPHLLATFAVLHLSYGCGSVAGLWQTRFMTRG